MFNPGPVVLRDPSLTLSSHFGNERFIRKSLRPHLNTKIHVSQNFTNLG